ncbi:DUF1456 family protein [Aliikangiella sp. IMCC44359]|uniref:DUF1456 family protein n=1 Tax=Aliikangiella sp. IMCC44359 TaxID=3459125 RepID=UPI00403AED53
MNNNDVLRRIRYIFNYNDSKMISIFALAEQAVTRKQVCAWLKKEEDDGYVYCDDVNLAGFLNGFINEKRGKKEGKQMAPEARLNNNLIFRKLRIALNLKDEKVLELLSLADFRLGKSELSAFFRKPGHQHYRECKEQILRNFLMGIQLYYRKSS